MRRLGSLLQYMGIAVAVLALSKVHAAWIAVPAYDFTGSFRFAWAVSYMVVLGITAYGFGLPEVPRSWRESVAAAFGASATATLVISLLQLLVGDAFLPRFVVFGAPGVLIPWYVGCNAVARRAQVMHQVVDRVVVVGSGPDVEGLAEALDEGAERPAVVASVLSVEELLERSGSTPGNALADLVAESRASVLVLDRDAQAHGSVVAQAAGVHEQGTRVRTLSLFYEQWLGKLPVSELERVSLMFDIGELHRARYGRLKRLMDITFGLMGVLPLGAVIVVVAVVNPILNRGPMFFRQERVGKNRESIAIIKFRTMRPVQNGTLANEWTSEGDPRITPFGRVLRRSHLDELPQVINVLKGDLSLVGPRPEQPHYVEQLRGNLPFYDLRHLVRPGITGWAQVKYGYAGDESDALQKLQYDFFYLRHQGLALDLRIAGRTVRAILRGQGR